MKAQIARGADFETGNLIQKAKNMIPLLVPLFISAFRRANDLAMAMEARCYHGGDNRTQMKPLHYESRDYISYVVMFAYLGNIVFRIWNVENGIVSYNLYQGCLIIAVISYRRSHRITAYCLYQLR